MPKVGKVRFPYSKEGRAKADAHARKTGQTVRKPKPKGKKKAK